MFTSIFRGKPFRTLKIWPALLCLVITTCSLSINSFASDEHGHHHDHEQMPKEALDDHDDNHEEKHDHDESVLISDATAKQSNIKTAIAQGGIIAKTERLYGKVVNDATQISHIGARFNGTIIQVNVNIGDHVKKGQALARIESNQSLHPYIVKAPFAGMITARHANPGELTQDQPLFTLFNDAILWAEFKVFPAQMRKVKTGQTVIIDSELFKVSHIIPSPNDAPFNLARVRLDNHDHGWSAGVVLKADVIIEAQDVNLRIDNQALQQFEGNTVVFVKHDSKYHAKPITLGLQDGQYSEVIFGINKGDEYVVSNSYLIKADFEKSSAEHVH